MEMVIAVEQYENLDLIRQQELQKAREKKKIRGKGITNHLLQKECGKRTKTIDL